MLGNVLAGDKKLKEAKDWRGATVRGLDWTKPKSWPTHVRLRDLFDDFQVLVTENFGIAEDEVFPLLRVPIDEVVVPEIDPDDDRDRDDEGNPSSYMQDLTEAVKTFPMPPIVVGNYTGAEAVPGKKFGHPYDGRHRLNAAVALKLKVIPAIDITNHFT